jgi:peptidylprolyl isomerase
LGDRSYLDGDYTVFGDVVQGMDVVMRIAQGDVVESVRIVRVGGKAEAFHPTTESFRAMVKAAEQRVAEHAGKKRAAEREWIARNYPRAAGPEGGVLVEIVTPGSAEPSPAPIRVRYRGRELRYMGDVIGREGPPIEAVALGSGGNGVPGFIDPPRDFVFEPGKTKINPGLDGVIAAMAPGERVVAIVPPAMAYGRAGLYPPETPGKRRFVISPNAMLVYDVERLPNE